MSCLALRQRKINLVNLSHHAAHSRGIRRRSTHPARARSPAGHLVSAVCIAETVMSSRASPERALGIENGSLKARDCVSGASKLPVEASCGSPFCKNCRAVSKSFLLGHDRAKTVVCPTLPSLQRSCCRDCFWGAERLRFSCQMAE
jgi:hypothetical protein